MQDALATNQAMLSLEPKCSYTITSPIEQARGRSVNQSVKTVCIKPRLRACVVPFAMRSSSKLQTVRKKSRKSSEEQNTVVVHQPHPVHSIVTFVSMDLPPSYEDDGRHLPPEYSLLSAHISHIQASQIPPHTLA